MSFSLTWNVLGGMSGSSPPKREPSVAESLEYAWGMGLLGWVQYSQIPGSCFVNVAKSVGKLYISLGDLKFWEYQQQEAELLNQGGAYSNITA